MNVQVNEQGVNVTGGIDVNVTEERVSIESDKLVIAKQGEGFVVRAEGFATIETNTDRKPVYPTVKYDPHYYYSGQNGLTLEESTNRAMDRVDDMLDSDFLPELTEYEDNLVREVVKSIIADEDTEGRHTVYTTAGGVLKGMRNGGYAGVPFAWLFKGVVEGWVTPAVTNAFGSGSYALTPIGRG